MKLRWWHFGCALAVSVALFAMIDYLWRFEHIVVRERGAAPVHFVVRGATLDEGIARDDAVSPDAVPPTRAGLRAVEALRATPVPPLEPVAAVPLAPAMAAVVRPVDGLETNRPAERVDPKPQQTGPGKPAEASRDTGPTGSGQRIGERADAAGPVGETVSLDAGDATVSNYPARVKRRLGEAVRYPIEARAERIDGTAVVRFIVADSGDVIDAEIFDGSGHEILDSAAIAAVWRAEPFPRIPLAADRSRWTFTISVEFILQ